MMPFYLWRKLFFSFIVSLLGFSLATATQAASVVLTGKILTTEDKPVSNITVSIDTHKISAATDQQGVFRLALPPSITEGDKLKLALKNTSYSLISPHKGIIYLPKQWSTEVISLIIRVDSIQSIPPPSSTPTKPNKSSNPNHFIIQIASLSDKTQVEKLIHKIQPSLTTAQSYYLKVPDKPDQYRVVIGDFDTSITANELKDKLTQQQLISKDSFVRKAW
ncbi:SPOR domain-containing protein [Thiofilum flexile]|uniref:SPOR domain-containing protein n=1 Tax=Thiofilum flexile TaxID=125627 RepID=UPI00037CA3F0|nr:SPOR domain-containing protein [Thiofilum flexile]